MPSAPVFLISSAVPRNCGSAAMKSDLKLGERKLKALFSQAVDNLGQYLRIGRGNAVEKIYCAAVSR